MSYLVLEKHNLNIYDDLCLVQFYVTQYSGSVKGMSNIYIRRYYNHRHANILTL